MAIEELAQSQVITLALRPNHGSKKLKSQPPIASERAVDPDTTGMSLPNGAIGKAVAQDPGDEGWLTPNCRNPHDDICLRTGEMEVARRCIGQGRVIRGLEPGKNLA
jgi:hypothetical protein